MCSAFNLDNRCDNRIINFFWNVFCPNTRCLDILCVQEKTYKSPSRSHYQGPQSSMQYSFGKNKFIFLEVWSEGLCFWRDAKINSRWRWRCVLSNMPERKVCSPFNQQNFQYLRLKKVLSLLSRAENFFKVKKPTISWFVGDATHWFARITSRDWEKAKPLPFVKKFFTNRNQAHPNLSRKRQKLFRFWHNRVDSPMSDTVAQKWITNHILYTLFLQYSIIVFWVSDDGFQ